MTPYIFQDILTLLNPITYIYNSSDIWITLSNNHYVIRRVLIDKCDLSFYMCEACKKGKDIKLINMLIELGAYMFEGSFYDACNNGHKDLVEIMIKHGANDFNWGLESACKGNHKNIVEFMIECGANTKYGNYSHFNRGLHEACINGNKEIAMILIEHVANDFNYGLCGACIEGHKDLVEFMIECGATYCTYCFSDHKLKK